VCGTWLPTSVSDVKDLVLLIDVNLDVEIGDLAQILLAGDREEPNLPPDAHDKGQHKKFHNGQ